MLFYLRCNLGTSRDLDVYSRVLHKLIVSVLRTADSYTASAVEVLSTTEKQVSVFTSEWIATAPAIKAPAKLIEANGDR
jgi:hypothetical protein